MAGKCEKSATEMSTSSSSSRALAKRSAQLLLSPYCWSAKKICEFLRDCWDLVKEEKGQELKPEIKTFRDEMNARALECELWAPFEHWTDFIAEYEFNALMRRNEGTPKPKIDKVDRLLQLIRNKVNHPENDSMHLTSLNWEPKDGGRIDWNRFADYWISKFVLLVPFVWSQFIRMKSSLSKYYPSDLLDLKTDWRKILFSPDEFANDLHAEFQKHLNSGFVDDRFEIATENSTQTVELRTLPGAEENLLNAILGGNLFKKIVISTTAITTHADNNNNEVFCYKMGSNIEQKKCVTYIFLSLDYKLNGKLYTDLFEGTNEKILIFTSECAMQRLASKIGDYENAKNVPVSWRHLSNQKRKSLKKIGQFEILGKIFGINEIVPSQEQDLLSHLEGKELNDFLRNNRLPILQNYRLPEVDRFYQEREFHDPAIISYDFFTEDFPFKNDVYVLVHENPNVNIVTMLPKRKIFPKLKLGTKTDKVYYLRSNIQEVINDIRNFEGCDNDVQVSVHFFEVINLPNCVRWIATHGSSAVVKKFIQDDSKSKLRMPEPHFLYMVDTGFVKNEIIFIANQCGMGKTQFLVNIATKLTKETRNCIPLYIFMTDFVQIIRAELKQSSAPTCDDILSAFSSFLCLSKFESEVFCRMLKSDEVNIAQKAPKIIIIFDGLDEVKSDMKELALKTLEILHQSFPGLPVIAAVRDDTFEKIKEQFGTPGCMLAPIEDPLRFMESHWRASINARVASSSAGFSSKKHKNLKRTLRSIGSPDLLIPKNKLFETVDSLDPKPKLIVVYDELNVFISPLLVNLENDIVRIKDEDLVATSVQNLVNLFKNISNFPVKSSDLSQWNSLRAKDFLLIDGSMCSEEDQDQIRFMLFNLIQNFDLSNKNIWVFLKRNIIGDVKTFRIHSLELQVLPISKVEEGQYLESFWLENVRIKRHKNILSHCLNIFASSRLASSLGSKNPLAGIPLQCRMIAEILVESVYKLDLSLVEMRQSSCEYYKIFLRRKFEKWFEEKYACVPVDSLLFEGFRNQFKRFLQYLALKLLFSEEIADQFRNELLVSQKLEKCEELYDAAIAQSILQSKEPLRFTHISFAAFFVAEFIYKNMKTDFSKVSNFKGKLESRESKVWAKEAINQALKSHIKNLISVYSEISIEHLGILLLLHNRLHPIFHGGAFSNYRTPKMDAFIARLMASERSIKAKVSGKIGVLFVIYDDEIFIAQRVLSHSPKQLCGYLIMAVVNLDFEIADYLVKELGLGTEWVCEMSDCSESKYGLLHWFIAGICCHKKEISANMFHKVKEKILEYSTENANVRKSLIDQRNSDGETPLLFLMKCMNYYKAPFDMKLYELLLTEFDADVNSVDSDGNSVLHFSCPQKQDLLDELVSNFFTEVFPNVIKFFLPRVKEKHSMNKLGFTPAVNFLLSLDEVRSNGLLSRSDVKNCVKCIKLFDYKKDFYERDEEGNASINKMINYLCQKYKGTFFAETDVQEKVNHLDKFFSEELEIDFGTVNNEGKGVVDFAFENESLVMIKLLEIKAPNLFTALHKKRFELLQKRIGQPQEIRIVTSFTII